MSGKERAPPEPLFEASSPDTARAERSPGGDDPSGLVDYGPTPPPEAKRQRRVSFEQPSAPQGLLEEGEIVEYTHASRAAVRLRAKVHLAQEPKYQVAPAARLYLRNNRCENIASFVSQVCNDFSLHDRVLWSATRLLFRYIGALAQHRAGESPHGATGGMGDFVHPEGAEIPQYTPTREQTTAPLEDSRLVEVAALASVLISSKVSEKASPCTKELAESVEDPTCAKDVCSAEMSMLTALQWDVAAPTPRQITEELLVSLGVEPPAPDTPDAELPLEWRTLNFYCDVAIDVRELAFEPASYTAAAALLALWAHMYRIEDMAHPLHRHTTHSFERAVVCGCEVAPGPARLYAETLRALHEEIRYKSEAPVA